jgi:hypothetical protein
VAVRPVPDTKIGTYATDLPEPRRTIDVTRTSRHDLRHRALVWISLGLGLVMAATLTDIGVGSAARGGDFASLYINRDSVVSDHSQARDHDRADRPSSPTLSAGLGRRATPSVALDGENVAL